MDDALFEELVEEALDYLPDEYLAHIENVGVIIEEWPSEDLLAEAGMEGEDPSELLGLYLGVPLHERDSSYSEWPDQIILFQGSILAAVGDDPEAIRREVRRTLLHEVAHYFGMDEEDLEPIEEQWRLLEAGEVAPSDPAAEQ